MLGGRSPRHPVGRLGRTLLSGRRSGKRFSGRRQLRNGVEAELLAGEGVGDEQNGRMALVLDDEPAGRARRARSRAFLFRGRRFPRAAHDAAQAAHGAALAAQPARRRRLARAAAAAADLGHRRHALDVGAEAQAPVAQARLRLRRRRRRRVRRDLARRRQVRAVGIGQAHARARADGCDGVQRLLDLGLHGAQNPVEREVCHRRQPHFRRRCWCCPRRRAAGPAAGRCRSPAHRRAADEGVGERARPRDVPRARTGVGADEDGCGGDGDAGGGCAVVVVVIRMAPESGTKGCQA